MRAGIATIALRRYDVFHALDLAAEAGFEGVEIWGKPPHTPEEFDEDHFRRVHDRARAYGLSIHMFGSYARPMLPDFEERSQDALKIAKVLGARKVRTWAGTKEPAEADDEFWSRVSELLREFALRAENEGITLAAEMHSGTLAATAEGALRLVEMVNAPNFKLNFQITDFSNPDVDRIVPMVADHVVNVHAQNYRPSPLEPGKMELSLLSEGTIDYDRVLSLLAQHGYKGWVEVEFLKGEAVSEQIMLESLKRDAAYLKGLVEKYSPAPIE